MADPDSSAPLGWKLKWFGLVVGALYSGYQVTNRWHWWPPVTLPLTWLDRAVPLLEWTVWPYLVLAGCIFLPLLLQDRHVFRRCMVALGCGYSVNLLIFAVWPTMLPREGLPDGWHHAAFAWLYAVDTPANCFPSGHITAPFIAFHALAREHRHWRGRLWLVFAMLCPTILTTKQHYVVDLLGGLATGMFGVWLSGKWAEWAVAPLTSSPGAQRNPFLNLLAFQRDPLGFLTAVGQGGGPVARCRLAWLRRTVISDPAVARAVLRLPLRTANKDTWSAALISRVSGRSVLTSNGDAWVRLRRLAQPAFHHERITAYSEDIHRLTTALISDWRAAPGGRLEVGTAMRRLTFRFICRALLSADPSREITALESAINRLLADTWRAIESPFLGRLRLATWERRAFDAALAEVRSFIQTQINTRRQSAAPTGRDLLAMLMAARDADTGAGLTDQDIINECITLIIGGHDSTANALAWSLALLAAHPDVADRLRAEATQSAAGEALARAVFLETLRLYPPIWLLERNVVEPATVGTWSFAAGEQLLICPWVLHAILSSGTSQRSAA
ncbi:MAG: cytochrome P450, partial [Limisphaerales bacterium]